MLVRESLRLCQRLFVGVVVFRVFLSKCFRSLLRILLRPWAVALALEEFLCAIWVGFLVVSSISLRMMILILILALGLAESVVWVECEFLRKETGMLPRIVLVLRLRLHRRIRHYW